VILKYLKIIAILTLNSPLFVHAAALDCNLRSRSQSEGAGDVQAAAIMGDENRQKFDKFAVAQSPLDKLNEAFAASGVINCGSEGSAQLTGASDVISTAAHLFFDSKCNLRPNLEKCYFYRPSQPTKHFPIDVSSMKSAKDTGGCYSENNYFDWAVVKLKDPVDGVVAYEIPTADPILNVDDQMVTVSNGDVNFKSGGPNIQVCSIRATWHFENVPLTTDCDTGDGSSGAGQFLLQGGKLNLDHEKLIMTPMNVAEKKGAVDGKAFNVDTQYNISIPVETEFLAALKALSGK
jgi:hypothetical protein